MTCKSSFQKLLPYFPETLRQPLAKIPPQDAADLQEIRLRTGRQLHAVRSGREYAVTLQGALRAEPADGILITPQMLDAVFRNCCAHSLHSFQDAIRSGFLTLAGGSRAGLCGTAVMQAHKVETVRGISSINLRIASERIGCAEALLQRLGGAAQGGLLIAGPPASGKTTVLRDIARILGDHRRICIMDERGEIAAVQNGVPQFAVGAQTDIFDGYPKAEGISAAVRVMSPELLICDEIGGEDETDALLHSLHTGVQIIASAHAGSIAELYERPQILRLIRSGVFRTAVLLQGGAACGHAAAIEPLRSSI